MEDKQNNNTIEDLILDAIKNRRIKMRPRWYFVVGAILFAAGTALLLLVLLYLASFIVFALHQTGVWFVPSFGSSGLLAFFVALPWLLVAILLIVLLALEIVVRHYAFANRKPIVYSLFALMAVVLIGALTIAPIHKSLFESAREEQLPVAGGLYRSFGLEHLSEVHRGIILERTSIGFIITNPWATTSTVLITPQTDLLSIGDFDQGDTVVVFGVEDDGVIRARGIQEIRD